MSDAKTYREHCAEAAKITYGVDLPKPGKDDVVDDSVMLGERYGRQPATVVFVLAQHFGWTLALAEPTMPACFTCEDTGWVQIHSERPPAFGMCPNCFNALDRPCP